MPFLKPTISRLHDARRFWRQGHKTFSGFIKAREMPMGKKTNERNGRRESRESQEHRGGGRTKKKQRRGKQRVRPLYFVNSSSSRAPSLAATAPGTGHCKREIQGDRGKVDRNREKKSEQENRQEGTEKERRKEQRGGETENREYTERTQGGRNKKKKKNRDGQTHQTEKKRTHRSREYRVVVPLRSFISRAISG